MGRSQAVPRGGPGSSVPALAHLADQHVCAAVAWHNHPRAEGRPATVLNAIANLDRVR